MPRRNNIAKGFLQGRCEPAHTRDLRSDSGQYLIDHDVQRLVEDGAGDPDVVADDSAVLPERGA